jgi:hypothetical protein
MATSGYAAKFGKGYLSGSGKEPDAKGAPAGEAPEGETDPEGQIQEHLQKMHAATGHGHSHIQHKGDGTHVAHHISHEGQMSGPEETQDCPGGMCGGGEGGVM